MLPTIEPGSWVVVEEFDDAERSIRCNQLKIGDLIAVRSANKEAGQAVHRVIGIMKNQVQTKGDNSVFADQWLDFSFVVGLCVFTRAKQGYWYKEYSREKKQPYFIASARLKGFRLSRIPRMLLTVGLHREKIMSINLDKSIEWYQVGNEMLIYSHSLDEMFALNETASIVWNCTNNGDSKEVIVNKILDQFDHEDVKNYSKQIETDIDAILANFKNKKLL